VYDVASGTCFSSELTTGFSDKELTYQPSLQTVD
jgi:hypothetical protein